MSVIVQAGADVHSVSILTPSGDSHEVESCSACGLRQALRAAGSLAGWLGVDEWESASAWMPRGVRKVIRELRKDFPDTDVTACVVVVVVPGDGPDAPNGREVVATYRPGSVVPELVRKIRAESLEAGWREECGHTPPRGPHTPDSDDDNDDDADGNTPILTPAERVRYEVG